MLDDSAEEIISNIEIVLEKVNSNETFGVESGQFGCESGVGGEDLGREYSGVELFVEDVGDGMEAVVVPGVDGGELPLLFVVGEEVVDAVGYREVHEVVDSFAISFVEVISCFIFLIVADSSAHEVILFRGEGDHSTPCHHCVVIVIILDEK